MSMAEDISAKPIMKPELNKPDTVRIERLELYCVIGINPWERQTKQLITIDIDMHTDLSKAGTSDSIEDTINYRDVCKSIIAEIENSTYDLIEAIGVRVANTCLADDLTQSVEVTIRKPGAVRQSAAVGVVIRRSKS